MSAYIEISPTTSIVRSLDQVSGDLDGKVVLLSIENGEYYNLNEVGSRIWTLLEKPTTPAELVERLMSEFEVERSVCEGEVTQFIKRLRAEKLLGIN